MVNIRSKISDFSISFFKYLVAIQNAPNIIGNNVIFMFYTFLCSHA